jgi:hypothetical protein
MNLDRAIKALPLPSVALLALAATIGAAAISYTTDMVTAFSGGGLIRAKSTGIGATLTFAPNANSVTATRSNIDLGVFTLQCPTCTTANAKTAQGASFNPLSVNLSITDVTDGNAKGTFVGTSTGGAVYSDLSGMTINSAPPLVGPGTTNATSGNFGTTVFSTTVFTGIPAPNSCGSFPGGVSTVEGFVSTSGVPEPAMMGLIGAALLALGVLRRKNARRK